MRARALVADGRLAVQFGRILCGGGGSGGGGGDGERTFGTAQLNFENRFSRKKKKTVFEYYYYC